MPDVYSLKGLKDATEEEIRLAQEVEDEEKRLGIPHNPNPKVGKD